MNDTFQPNLTFNFWDGVVKCNRIAETMVGDMDGASISLNGEPLLTFFISDIHYWPLAFDEDENEWYRDFDNEYGGVLLYEGDYLNTGVRYPYFSRSMDDSCGLNIKVSAKNYISEITRFIFDRFAVEINELSSGKEDASTQFVHGWYDGWDIDDYPFHFSIGVYYGDRDGLYYGDLFGEFYYNPHESYNLSIERRFLGWRTSIICLPSYSQIIRESDVIKEADSTIKSKDGINATIIVEGSHEYRNVVVNRDLSKLSEYTTIICADDRVLNAYSYSVSGENGVIYEPEGENHGMNYNLDLNNKKALKGYFIVDGIKTKFIAVTPGTVIKAAILTMEEDVDGGKETVAYWFIKNGGQFDRIDGEEGVVVYMAYDKSKKKLVGGEDELGRVTFNRMYSSNEDEYYTPLIVTKEFKTIIEHNGYSNVAVRIVVGSAYDGDYFQVDNDVVDYSDETKELFARARILWYK